MGAFQWMKKRHPLYGSVPQGGQLVGLVFLQQRLDDLFHRINLTLYSLGEVVGGAVEQVIEPLLQEYQADQLAALGD